jgi:hypothetical protein
VDLIAFLSECSEILRQDGTISLAIPDKRYTFDYFRETSSIRTVIDNHIYREHFNHSLGTILEHYMSAVLPDSGGTYMPNSSYLMKDHMAYNKYMETINELMKNYDEKEYIDCHSWIFTPASLKILIYQLNILNYIDLYIDDIYKVPHSIEFLVKLRKGRILFNNQELLDLQLELQKEYKESNSYDLIITEWSKSKKIYIYGTGEYTKKILPVVNNLNINIEGFVISDNQPVINHLFFNKPIYHLSDIISERNNSGILICVGDRYYKTVELSLNEKGFKYYL